MPASTRISRPSSAFVPSRRITIGARSSTRPQRLDDALGDLVAAGDATEDVDEDRLHVLVEVDHLERRRHHVGVGAATDVEEVGGLAADLVDDVERAIASPAPLAMMPTDAVEPDVLQVVRAGELLALVELLGRAELVPLGMAEGGVVVEADLGVEGVHAAVGSQDQRVDLGQVAVALGEAAVQLHEDVGDAVERRRGSPASTAAARAVVGDEPVDRVDVEHHDRVGILLGDRLDLDAALGGQHQQVLLRRRGRA